VGFFKTTAQERIFKYVLIALILGFFFIPLVTFFGDYDRPWSSKHTASMLLIFFR